MTVNFFKPRAEPDIVEEFLRTSETPLTIPAMLADSAARHQHRIAFQQRAAGEWQRATFEQQYRRSTEFAEGLVALGVQPGDRVALVCENGISWATAYFGIAIAGAVGVPLYYELKTNEIEALVKRSGAKLIIASTKVLERLGDALGGADRAIAVGGGEERAGQAPGFLRRGRPGLLPFDQVAAQATDASRAELATRHVEPDDVASIVFTSGTTGGMKGVMLTHKNFMSNVESARRTLQFDERDRLVLVLPLHHAFPFVVFLVGFAAGGEMTFENDLLRVRDRLKEQKPTVFIGVPALFEQVYRAVVRRAEAEGRLEMFERGLRAVDAIKRRTGVNLGKLIFREVHQQLGGSLRFAISGGAALTPEGARDFYRLGLPLLQGWGLSEAAPIVAVQRWQPRKFFFSTYYEDHVGTVGPPIEGVEVSLIDVPEKEIYVHLHGEGELVVRGANVFAGYWQAPAETAAAKAGEWLRTGDLGRLDEDGNIWITGRSKYVIVLDSGEKVVPDELEEHFGRSELIQDVCIVPRQHRNKTQVGAIIYPNVEEARQRLLARAEQPSEQAVRAVVQAELDALAKDLAQHKRVSDLILTDTPLPRTALQDVARGEVQDAYSFDVQRWLASAELAPAPPEPAEEGDADAGD